MNINRIHVYRLEKIVRNNLYSVWMFLQSQSIVLTRDSDDS